MKYSISNDSFFIDQVDIITAGGRQNLMQYFKEWKETYSIGFKIGAVITGLLAGFGLYYLLKAVKERRKEKKRMVLDRGNAEFPDNETCTICMISRRDIILLPCRHLSICRLCFTEIPAKCPNCQTEFNDHITLNYTK